MNEIESLSLSQTFSKSVNYAVEDRCNNPLYLFKYMSFLLNFYAHDNYCKLCNAIKIKRT